MTSRGEPITVKTIRVEDTPQGEIRYYWLHIINNSLGEPIRIPVIVARGAEPGPVLGLTAAIHGNELNGIPVIQKVFRWLDPKALRGTVIGIPACNIPGIVREQRNFNDGVDLNRISPGRSNGNISEVYINRFCERILRHFDFMIDLHTASVGRVNSLYVRADMKSKQTADIARLQSAQIIVHNPPNDGSLRGTAGGFGITAITVELCDPLVFQPDAIDSGLQGIKNTLAYLKMSEGQITPPATRTVLCERSYWIYTNEGGLLRVFPGVTDRVSAGDKIADVTTVFGKQTAVYEAPEAGIVIGKNVNPLNQTITE